jgi:hypothetical protein
MKNITVNELIRQLSVLKDLGYGEATVWFRDENSMDYRFEEGVWDTDPSKENVVLA